MILDEGCDVVIRRNEYCHKCDANRYDKDWCGYVLDCKHRPLFDKFISKEEMEKIYSKIHKSVEDLKKPI